MQSLCSQFRVFVITAFCAFIVFLLLPVLAHAQSTQPGFVALAPAPPTSKLGVLYGTQGDLSGFINGLFKFALAVGAILAVLRLAYAGYLYMGQSDMWSHKGQAKTIMGDVVLGLLLLLSIWLILNQINPDILTLNALKNIKANPTPTPAATTPLNSTVSPLPVTGPGSNDLINGLQGVAGGG